jgi:L-iditol 2-dehydrogenase
LRDNDDIRYEDYPDPALAPGHLMVKVKASGVCGSDVPRVLRNGAHFYPIVLGHEFSGEVVGIGEGAEGFAPGDRVTGAPLLPCMECEDCRKGNYSLCGRYSFIGSRVQGSFAELISIPARNAVKFGEGVSFEHAAFFEPSTVALHGLRLNRFAGGVDTAVVGGGTIGLFTLLWAKIFGAKTVAVFDISKERLALAKSLGADLVVDTSEDKFDKSRYGFVFEAAGLEETMRLSFELAAKKAHVCFIGTPAKEVRFSPSLWELMNRKEFLLTGSWMSYSAPFPGEEWALTSHGLSTGALRIDPAMIFRRFPLSQAKQAFELFKNPSQVKGKVLLVAD